MANDEIVHMICRLQRWKDMSMPLAYWYFRKKWLSKQNKTKWVLLFILNVYRKKNSWWILTAVLTWQRAKSERQYRWRYNEKVKDIQPANKPSTCSVRISYDSQENEQFISGIEHLILILNWFLSCPFHRLGKENVKFMKGARKQQFRE